MRFESAMSTLGGSQLPPQEMRSTYSTERDLPPTPTSPVPSFSEFQHTHIPLWTRELNARATTRPSRASSVVSTQTRFSTTTIGEDARSIDIQVGGQTFRISRDGSTVKNDAPPPYSASETKMASPILEEMRPYLASVNGMDSTNTAGNRFPSTMENRVNMEGNSSVKVTTSNRLRANILDPSEVDLPSPVDDDQADEEVTPPSTPRAGRQMLEESVFGRGYPTSHRVRDDLQRSNTVRRVKEGTMSLQQKPNLPLLSTGRNILDALSSAGSRQSRSADAALSGLDHLEHPPPSPSFIGKKATGVFPFPAMPPIETVRSRSSNYTPQALFQQGAYHADTPESMHTPDVDSENEISLHYTRMIRFIDRDHRRALHAKDKELAELRERLHEKDTVYRQELKARDFKIDDLKRRLEYLEDSTELKLEKARHEVEDLWESRWRTQSSHLKEKMQNIETEARLDLARSRESLGSQDDHEKQQMLSQRRYSDE